MVSKKISVKSKKDNSCSLKENESYDHYIALLTGLQKF